MGNSAPVSIAASASSGNFAHVLWLKTGASPLTGLMSSPDYAIILVSDLSRWRVAMGTSIACWECIVAWDILILKILAVRSDGKATTGEISRDLAIVDRNARTPANDHFIDGGLFGAKLITAPQRGVWQITDRGRHYLNNHATAYGLSAGSM